jgi:predicted RNA-binding protein with RPS1 domain
VVFQNVKNNFWNWIEKEKLSFKREKEKNRKGEK